MRRTGALRDLIRETELPVSCLVAPIFVESGLDGRAPIAAMPGVERLSVSEALAEAGELAGLGIPAVLLFGIPAEKDDEGSGAWDDEGAVQLAVRAIKQSWPDLLVITDVCLCEYTSHGHCGVLRDSPTGEPVVDNDASVELLARVAVSHARAGADIVAPSDMMDGRVGALRAELDACGF
ncbi:MAG: porphobilinogen synthase, partial [Solirubrobacteraceae bacterium]|nr:porphobilinogen synthase [Solirubrobacteraceae bacterium]